MFKSARDPTSISVKIPESSGRQIQEVMRHVAVSISCVHSDNRGKVSSHIGYYSFMGHSCGDFTFGKGKFAKFLSWQIYWVKLRNIRELFFFIVAFFSQSSQNESSSIIGKHVSQSHVVFYVTLILKHLNNTMPWCQRIN